PHPRRHTPRRVVGDESAYGTLSTTARQRHAGETSTESANHRVESGNHIMTPPRVHICVVCSGNICRSPMAKVILTEHLRNAGLAQQVRVSSAGVGSWHIGHPMDHRAMSTLREHGYSGEHVAAQLDQQHLDADLLLAADTGHLQAL